MDLASLMLLTLLIPGQAAETTVESAEAGPELQVLKSAHISDSDSELLAYFQRRTSPPRREEVQAAIKHLKDGSAAERDQAAAMLISWGEATVPFLRQTANNIDERQAATLARDCLTAIEGPTSAALSQSVARLLAARRPAGAARALLDYLPRSEDETVLEALENALAAVGVEGGKPAAALLEAAKDPLPVRRTVAVRVLGRIGGTAALAAVRPLLKDSRPSVRMEAALSLLQASDGEAFPVLIDLVSDLSPTQREQVEALLNELAGEWAIRTPVAQDPISQRMRRELWAAWWRSTSGERLLDEVRARTLSDEERAEALEQIAALGSSSSSARETASSRLVQHFGKRAVSLLQRARQEQGEERARAIDRCLEAIGRGADQPLPEATFRLLALRQPPGAVEALLAYTPFVESPSAQAELEKALAVLACPDGQPVQALSAALGDALVPRRLTAARAMCRAAGREPPAAVVKLLQDRDREVRLQVALELAQRGSKDAVGVLIGLLGELPLEKARPVEDYLVLLAGDRAPEGELAEAPSARDERVESWRKWWRDNAGSVEMARLSSGKPAGLVIIEQQPLPPNLQGRVLELDSQGKVRWEMGSLSWPCDCRLLPGGQVLVVEQQHRLTQRDRKGKVLWERSYPSLFQVEPLGGGAICLLCGNRIVVVDRNGKEVFSHTEPVHILGGCRLPNGQSAYFTNQGGYVRLDARGKVVKTAHVAIPMELGITGLEILPGDRILVSLANSQKVCEYNLEGKVVWEATVGQPGSPHRLANGRTLVPIHGANQIVELDRRGKIISEKKGLPYRPFRIVTP